MATTRVQHHPAYQYKPLSSETSIRLIQIERRAPSERSDDQLRMFIVEADLNDSACPVFHCLSYTWGLAFPGQPNSASTNAITTFVNDCPKGGLSEIAIMSNLRDFLDQLRARRLDDVNFVWIDALCINQADLSERATQVQMMGRVYSSCIQVIVWLGVEDDDSRAAVELMHRALPLKSTAVQGGRLPTTEPISEAEGRSYIHFLDRNWFHRKWVLQEIVLAKSAVFWCGDASFDADSLVAAHSGVGRCNGRVKAPQHPMVWQSGIFERAHNGYYSWYRILRHLVNRIDLEYWHGQVGIGQARDRESSDPRDSVYSTLGLPSMQGVEVTIDYNRPAADIFTEFSREGLRACRSNFAQQLEGRAHRRTPDLPSWVPDLAVVCTPNDWTTNGGYQTFSAGGGKPGRFPVELSSGDARVMALRGVLVDTIEYVGGRQADSYSGECFAEALIALDRLPRGSSSHEQDLVESFWRTLACGPGWSSTFVHEEAIPSFTRVMTFYLGKWISVSGGLDSADASSLHRTLDSLAVKSRLNIFPSWEQLQTMSARFDAVCGDPEAQILTDKEMEGLNPYLVKLVEKFHERCFFITDHGRMGIGPEALTVGTQVWAIDGSDYLFVMNQRRTGRFDMLGVGYVHGIMFGEALEGQEWVRIEID